jgi:PAS domain S-box-containing protein
MGTKPPRGEFLETRANLSGNSLIASVVLRLHGAALESAANGIVITDRAGSIVWSNRAFARLTGYQAGEIAGQNMRIQKSGAHPPKFYAQMWQTLLSGKVWRGELINRRRNGTLFIQDQTITPLRDEEGTISHFLAIQQDITERKQREQALRELEQKESLVAERTRLARDMHDGLGAGLTRIKVLSERIENDGSQPAKTKAHARLISATTRELAQCLDEIVWAVNPQKDRLENLGSYLAAYADDFLSQANLRCRLDVPEVLPEIPVSARSRQYVFLAVKEALNNVVKHARATEVRLHLAMRENRLVIRVSDNGRGFTLGRLSRIGQGVQNMKARLTDAGGECVIQSRQGKGTMVRMTIPLQPR